MALGNRRSADIFNKNTGDNADAKSITSAKELEIKADFEAGVHIADEGMFNNMAPALYAVQQVAEDIEELRRFVGAEVDATPSWVPSSNPNYLVSSDLSSYLPTTGGTIAGNLSIDHPTSTSQFTLRRDIAGDSEIIGDVNWNSTAAEGSDDRLALIRTETQGGGTTTRGGAMRLFTRKANSSSFNSTSFDQAGNWSFPSNISVNGTVDGVDIGANYANWNTAYGWGNHASAGYLTSSSTQSKYLRGDASDYFNGKLIWGGSDYADGIDMSLGNINHAGFMKSDEFRQRHSGRFRNNLGDPTVTEMALFEAQFGPKTTLANDYDDLTDLTFWSQETSSSDWVEVTSYSDDQKRRFLRTNNSSIIIPNTYYKFRVEFKARAYTFANAVYMYWSSQSHRSQVHVWKKRCSDGTWLQHTSATNTISSWPGHGWVPFSNIPWHETNTTSTGHFTHIRVEFTPTWIPYSGSGTDYSTRNINLYGMQIWGGYPSGRRTPHYYDQNGEFNFLKDAHILDNNRLYIGTGGDLQLYHDGSNSYIDEAGTGNLVVRANSQLVAQKYTGETMFKGIADGAFEAYHNNVKKFETTGDGATVTGKLSTTAGLQVSGTGWQSYGLTVSSTTSSGAVIHLNNTERAFQISSRGNSLDFRDITAGDARRLYISNTGKAFFEGDVDVAGDLTFDNSDDYLNAKAFQKFIATTADYDTLTTRGLYRFQGGANGPSGTNHTTGLTLTQDDGNYGFQLVTFGSLNTQEGLHYRYKGTSWGPWQTIVTKTFGDARYLLDSEVTNLAQVKAFDSSDYATAAQGTKADNALPKAGGTMTGSLTIESNSDAIFSLKQTDAGSTSGTKEGGWNYMQFLDGQGDRQAYFGIDNNGNLKVAPEISGRVVSVTTGLGVSGDITVSGLVDGRDIATDGTKLDTIATNADVTPSWVPSSDPGYGTSNLALGTTSSTALAGNTTTISTAQANAITANTAKRDARYIYIPVVCNFYGDLSTGEYHVPFSDGETESTSTTNRRNQFVAPCDGHFHKVIVRSNNSTLERGSATDLTIKSKKVVAGTASVTTLETKVVDTVAAETKMVTTFDSTNSAFDEGDRLLLSMQLTDGFPRGSKSYFVTVVFKIDQSDLD